MNYSRSQVVRHIQELGYPIYDFTIIGVRSRADKPNEFDDRIYCITPLRFHSFAATTNPGTHWLLNLLNPKGAAVLKPGLYWYQLGTHKDYPALVQASAVTVFRDRNKDNKSDASGVEDVGWFGINIHRASATAVSKFVDKWSAGCQVIANPADFKILMDECRGSGKNKFPYILVNEF